MAWNVKNVGLNLELNIVCFYWDDKYFWEYVRLKHKMQKF